MPMTIDLSELVGRFRTGDRVMFTLEHLDQVNSKRRHWGEDLVPRQFGTVQGTGLYRLTSGPADFVGELPPGIDEYCLRVHVVWDDKTSGTYDSELLQRRR